MTATINEHSAFYQYNTNKQMISQLTSKQLELEQSKYLQFLLDKGIGMIPPSLFAEAVEQSPLAISITDKKANILYINKAFTEVTGYQASEVVGKNESLLSYKATPRNVYYDLWYNISRNNTWNGQLINRHKNGEPYLADLTVAPMQDSSNKIKHYLGIHRDISEQHRNEKKAQNQKHLIESVINAASVAMVVMDQERKIILDNQVYKALVSDLNHKEPAYLFLDLLANDFGDINSYLKEHPEGFKNIEIRLDVNHKNTPLWFSCSGKMFKEAYTDAASFFEEEGKDYLLLSISDVTRQHLHKQEQHLQGLKDMLAEEEQMRSIRETLLGAIHQISQPLHQTRAAVQLMQQKNEHGALLDLLVELEKHCQQSIDTMRTCIPEILPGAITAINLNQILHEILQLSDQKLLSNGIAVKWKPAVRLSTMLGSENKLRMLFKQLLDNAINAFKGYNGDERMIEIITFENQQRIYISITDSGPGIAPEIRNKVFQPFFTTQKWGGIQAGMGLVMVKEITNQFNGSIEIDPDYMDGCRFIISFPMTDSNDYGSFDP